MNENGDEAGLLDLLVLAAENLRLLVLVPAAVGLAALGLTYVVPQTYSSEAVLALPVNGDACSNLRQTMHSSPSSLGSFGNPQQVATMMASPAVLDSARTRGNLQGRVEVTVGKDNLLRLRAAASSPKEAQVLADAVIEAWLKTTVPAPREREELLKRRAYAQAGLDSVESLLQRLPSAGITQSRKLPGAAEGDAASISLHQLRNQYLDEVMSVTRVLEGLQRDVLVKQPPTLPAAPVAPKTRLMLALSVLSALLLVFLWILLRQAWARAAQVPESAQKQQRLLTALGLRKKPAP